MVDHQIVIMGAGTVGKSAITIRMVADHFKEDHDATIEDRYECNLRVGNVTKKIGILDTAGQGRYIFNI